MTTNFLELVKMNNKDEYMDFSISNNISTIQYERKTSPKQTRFLATFLKTLPFLSRLSVD